MGPLHQQVLDRIRGEFREMPGMTLTLEQVARLCGVERALCQAVLDALVDARFLHRKVNGAYARPSDATALPRFAKATLKATLPAPARCRAN